jgi:hypothetical protein
MDDTRDLIDGWTAPDGTRHRGVLGAGGHGGADAPAMVLLQGGRHDQPSWARMLPIFLRWAYGVGDAAGQQD